MTENLVTINSSKNNVIVSTPGPQGPRGRTILNGVGNPANNLGLEGDFYYNTVTTEFYGPKPSDTSWDGAAKFFLDQSGAEYATVFSWEISQVVGPVNGIYSLFITHNLGFYPNVTVKTSSGDILETGIDYNNINQITLTMAQPFAGTAYLS